MRPDPARLRAVVEHLQAIERPSASDGEREAAEWIRDRLAALGCRAAVEEERGARLLRVPLRCCRRRGAAAGLSRRGRRAAPRPPALGARRPRSPTTSRRARTCSAALLPRRTTFNVVAEAGDPDGAATLVFVAHHDAAHGGLVFHPGPTRCGRRRASRAGTSGRRPRRR